MKMMDSSTNERHHVGSTQEAADIVANTFKKLVSFAPFNIQAGVHLYD